MRTPASENQDAIALLTKDQLWNALMEAEQHIDDFKEWYLFEEENGEALSKQLAEAHVALLRLQQNRPLKDWPSDLLVWLFWSDGIEKYDLTDTALLMIHTEMNARGEGERVAV